MPDERRDDGRAGMAYARANGVRGVLLDVDGTLVDSNAAHARAFADVLAREGYDIPAERVLPLIGMGGGRLIARLTGLDEEAPRAKAIATAHGERFLDHYVPMLRLTPGARELIARLRELGYRLVVATSAREEELQAMLAQVGLDDLLPRRTSASDVEEAKPEPDVVHEALREGGLQPGEAVLLGDTPYDVEAARRAGVATIAVRCGGWDDDGLRGAVAVYDDPAHLLRELVRSPLAPGTA